MLWRTSIMGRSQLGWPSDGEAAAGGSFAGGSGGEAAAGGSSGSGSGGSGGMQEGSGRRPDPPDPSPDGAAGAAGTEGMRPPGEALRIQPAAQPATSLARTASHSR